ncbi:hypothetical protein [Rhodanobacter sp. B04]|uniref:hypothetical protein n=1 Tax=Rhodanobacter sp. B04 TaxID=1945860 RepID=UPI001115935A|nr:hypothetical protein [Rhodanobacter sp. B04]
MPKTADMSVGTYKPCAGITVHMPVNADAVPAGDTPVIGTLVRPEHSPDTKKPPDGGFSASA